MSTGLKTRPSVTVVTAGTRVALATKTAGSRVADIQAVRLEGDDGNAGAIFVGDLNVSATRYVTKLAAGDSFTIEGSAVDITTVFVDADTSGSVVQIGTL